MASVTGLTAARMLAIEAASVVSGEVDEDGHLILTTHGGTEIDAGLISDFVNTIVDGEVDGSGDLILTTLGGSTINAGHVKGANGTAGADGASFGQFVFTYTGTLPASPVVGTYMIFNDSSRTWTITSVRASVAVASAGTSVIVDVNKGTTPGTNTTIFGTQSARPTIAAGSRTNKSTGMTVTTLAPGEYLTVDIDQSGSTPASGLTVQIDMV